MARRRGLRGATRTCVRWQTVRVNTASGRKEAKRCAKYTGGRARGVRARPEPSD